jgi:hypothetical protein
MVAYLMKILAAIVELLNAYSQTDRQTVGLLGTP